MKIKCASAIATFLTLSIPVILSPSAYGEPVDHEASTTSSSHPSTANEETVTIQSDHLNDEDAAFIKHVGDAGEAFIQKDGKIALSVSDEDLKSKYGFDTEEVQRLHQNVLGKSVSQTLDESNSYASRASVHGNSVCFSHQDLMVGVGAAIVAAADAGPAAIAAALQAAATAFGGPVGAVLGSILTLASAPSLIEIGGRAATAAATNRGLKIGIHWDYPPVYADYC